MLKRRDQAGFTLVELVVFIVVVSLALTGVILVINRTVTLAPEALVRTRALEIAQAYLDEIATRRYDENTGQGGVPRCDSSDPGAQPCSNVLGPEGETRAVFDDVDDYHGLDDSPPVDVAGNPFPGYDGYRVRISVAYAGAEVGLANDRLAKRVSLVITAPDGQTIPVTFYRGNF